MVVELKLTLKPGMPVPFLVVMRTTPPAARDPYNAAAFGPLRIDTVAMSSGFSSAAPLP